MVYDRIPPEDIESVESHVFCEEHGCIKFKDLYGNFVCIVCLVEDRLELEDETFDWVDDYSVQCPDCGNVFQANYSECPDCGRKK